MRGTYRNSCTERLVHSCAISFYFLPMYPQRLNLLKRQSEMLNFERDLRQSHVNLTSYVIKSQAQNGEKFLTLLGMTSKISNDTDVNKVNIERCLYLFLLSKHCKIVFRCMYV